MDNHTRAAIVLALACAANAHARAQEATGPAPAEPVPTVETRGVRDPAMLPYADAYRMLSRVEHVGEGRVGFAIRVVSAQTGQPLPDLAIALQGENTFDKLALDDRGFVTVPLDRRYVDDKAEFVSNKKKGSIKAHMTILPLLPRENLTYADLAATFAAGKRAVAELVPWYLRLFVGRIHAVRLCYPDAAQQVGIGGGPSRPANRESKNSLDGKTVYCAEFDEDEVQAAPRTTVAPAPGYVALFR